MVKNNTIELIFTEWKASLKSRDRGRKSVRPNFEDLFSRWKSANSSFEELYESWLPKAITAHQPTPSVARSTFKRYKQILPNLDKNQKEFIDEWNQSIEDTATQTFFEFFPATRLDDDNNEPKVYGSMSAKEYNLQRRYMESIPILDTTELEKQWKQETQALSLEDLLKNVLGNKDETNS